MSETKNKTFSRIGTGAAGLAVLLVIIGAVNLIVANMRIRLDLTGEKLYTLSKGSRQVLGSLENDVTLKFYFSSSSPEMPMALKTYANQVQDLLKEYELAGKGRVTLEAYDPKPDSDAEEWAQRYGIEPQQTNPFGQPVYFGLVAVSGETEQSMPGLNPRTEATLEYDITRLITRVAWPEKPVVGVMSSLSVLGQPQNPMMMQRRQPRDEGWAAFRELRKDYTVREVNIDVDKIDEDIKTLVVIHPKNLSDKALFAIDQFVLRGGRLIACVDPFSVADFEANQQQNPMMMQMGGGAAGPSTLGKLFDSWGVTFDNTKVVADISCATKLNAGNGRVEDNPAFLSLGKANMANDDLLTSQLSSVMMPFAGALSDNTAKDLTFTPLITTSDDNACLVDQMSAQFGVSAMRAQLKPDGARRVLAARLQGAFKTAFPDGPGAGGDDADNTATNKPADMLASGSSTVMLFADADFFNDRFSVQVMNTLFGAVAQPINDNLTLFGNTVEQSAGREELIGVRSRGQFNRPFAKVDALEVKAMKQWQAEEQRLESALQETQQRLSDLQQKKTGNERMILSREQQDELARFRKQQADTRRQLKDVRKNLNRDIERLGLSLKVVNIALIPVLVIGFGIFRGIRRKKR
ncbi:MAG: Gldg family protein [Kiritimatiellae bacterium]|nr:Gldg family protein [Kiritimatiellia bacterium]MDD3544680.1 Gldg family protein [Kiritimatiellia bacterium]MDD4621992.1 Gldg family protein [Kiritimatiellia bacterium]